MKKRNGFTLIELLAVLVILTVIGLIAVPIIMKTIEKAKKGASKNSAYGITKAAENAYAKEILKNGKITEKMKFEYLVIGTNPKLDFKGLVPTNGSVIIYADGSIEMAIVYDKYCITKDYDDDIVEIEDYNAAICVIKPAE